MEQIKKGDLIMGKNTWTRFIAVSDPYPKLIVGTYSSIETLVVDVTREEQWTERDRLLGNGPKVKRTSLAVRKERQRRAATGWF